MFCLKVYGLDADDCEGIERTGRQKVEKSMRFCTCAVQYGSSDVVACKASCRAAANSDYRTELMADPLDSTPPIRR